MYRLKPDGSFLYKCTAPVWGVKEYTYKRQELWVDAEYYGITSVMDAYTKAQEIAGNVERAQN